MVWLVLLFWWLLPVQAATFTQAVAVADSLPTEAVVRVNEDMIHLVANATKPVYFSGSMVDANGCLELMDPSYWQVKAYRTGLAEGFACTPDGNNCYQADNANLVFSDCADSGDSTLNYGGHVDLQYFADATDMSSDFAGDDWTLELHFVLPALKEPIVAASQFEVASLIAAQYNATIVDYGRVPLGADSAVQTVTITSIGNSPVDILQTVSGDFICSGAGSAVIPLTQLKYHLANPSFTWDDPTATVLLPLVKLNLDLPQQTNEQVSRRSIYYRLRMPLAAGTISYSGNCLNRLSLTAIANDQVDE
jgi:hypothetical protein